VNLKLSAWADLSPFASLESVAGSWECEASTAPAKPLPLGMQHLDLTGEEFALLLLGCRLGSCYDSAVGACKRVVELPWLSWLLCQPG